MYFPCGLGLPSLTAQGSKNDKPNVLSRVFEAEVNPTFPVPILPPERVVVAVTWGVESKVCTVLRNSAIPAGCPEGLLFVPYSVRTRKTCEISLCVELREPNRAVIIDNHPLSHMEDLFTELKGATMFSSIDLNNAYLGVMLHEDSRDLTAFITHDVLLRFRRVPYGLVLALVAFSKNYVYDT